MNSFFFASGPTPGYPRSLQAQRNVLKLGLEARASAYSLAVRPYYRL